MYKIFIKYYGELIDEVSGVDGAGDCQEEYELGEEYIVESVRLLEKKIKELLQNATSNLLGNPFVVDEETDTWGIKVENVELKDVALPEEMKRVIAKVAEAEREKQAVITKAAGEVEASNNLAKAAEIMSNAPGALHLRTLATLNDLSSDQSNTVVFAIPIEGLEALKGIANRGNKE